MHLHEEALWRNKIRQVKDVVHAYSGVRTSPKKDTSRNRVALDVITDQGRAATQVFRVPLVRQYVIWCFADDIDSCVCPDHSTRVEFCLESFFRLE